MKIEFKPGDIVRNKQTGEFDTVKSVPGMPEYERHNFIDAEEGFVLERESWEFQDEWELVKKPETRTNTAKNIRSVLRTEIKKCEKLTTDEDGAVIHIHYPQEFGSYKDGLLFAYRLLDNQ